MSTTSSSINLVNSVIDVGTIVDNLIYVDSAPVRNMQSQVTTLQSKISAFQSLNTRISTLADKIDTILYGTTNEPLINPYTFSDRLEASIFNNCKVTSSNSDAISATADNANTSGTYSISVTSLAQTKSMAASNFADAGSTKTGTGTLTIITGDSDAATVTIGASNNTLTGVCNAINDANAGVTATIINDGTSSPYRLLITANNAGTANSFTVTDNLSGGQALSLEQKQAASDAVFVLNGVSITKSSNTISDVIPGVTFTLKAKTAGVVDLTVDKDIDSIISSLNDFVSAYNSVNSYINSQFAYNSTTKTAGLLSGDSTLRSIQSNLQNQITQSISNRFTSYTVAGQAGLEFNRDGSLTLDSTKLRTALSSNFSSVAALFLGNGTPSDGATTTDRRVTYDSKTSSTQSGTYSVQVTSLAQKAALAANQNVTTLSDNETLIITSGAKSATVNLLKDASLSSVLSSINSALSAQGMAITAINDGTDKIRLAANNYGSDYSFSVVSDRIDSSGSTGFGTTPVNGVGTDIAGLINGHAASGNGLSLTGATGQQEEGLKLSFDQTLIGGYGSVTVAPANQGIEGASILMNLHSILDGITDPLSGPIHNSTDAFNQNIKSLNDEITSYQARLAVEKQMLTDQYNQADQALRMLTVTQSSLSSQLSKLSS
jgi:flagellar hook-associated protein 2